MKWKKTLKPNLQVIYYEVFAGEINTLLKVYIFIDLEF